MAHRGLDLQIQKTCRVSGKFGVPLSGLGGSAMSWDLWWDRGETTGYGQLCLDILKTPTEAPDRLTDAAVSQVQLLTTHLSRS